MGNINNCQPCAPVPSVPLAPPPTCPSSNGCEEYVYSDCVISTIDSDCQYTYDQPNGNSVTVGLNIYEGTTLTDVYSQLTSTACPLNINVIGGTLALIGNNAMLFQMFSTLVCNVNCGDPCDSVQSVDQMTFTSIGITGFTLNWFGLAGYDYSIRINDSNASPATYYTWQTSSPLTTSANTSIGTASFTKHIGSVITTPPPGMVIAANHSYEVLVTATYQGTTCETGPFTVETLPDPSCVCTNTITVVPAVASGTLDPLELSVGILVSGTIPIQYKVVVKDSNGTVMINPPDGDIIPYLPDSITNYTYYSAFLPAGGNYTVIVTSICSLIPYCTGGTTQAVINVPDSLSCSPPDITAITVNS